MTQSAWQLALNCHLVFSVSLRRRTPIWTLWHNKSALPVHRKTKINFSWSIPSLKYRMSGPRWRSLQLPDSFTSRNIASGSHWMRGRVGPLGGLGIRTKSRESAWKWNPILQRSIPWPNRYTNWVTLRLFLIRENWHAYWYTELVL